MSDDDLRKYAPRMSSVLRHVDPKFVNERKARALGPGETAGEETLAEGAAPGAATEASPWGKEAPAPLAVDPKALPSAFAPREEPDTLNDGLVTPVEPAAAVRGGQKRVWVVALVMGLAAVVVAVGLWSRSGKEDEKGAVSVAAPAASGTAEVAPVAVPEPEVTAPAVEEPAKEPVVRKAVEVGKPVPTSTQPAPASSGIVPELY